MQRVLGSWLRWCRQDTGEKEKREGERVKDRGSIRTAWARFLPALIGHIRPSLPQGRGGGEGGLRKPQTEHTFQHSRVEKQSKIHLSLSSRLFSFFFPGPLTGHNHCGRTHMQRAGLSCHIHPEGYSIAYVRLGRSDKGGHRRRRGPS